MLIGTANHGNSCQYPFRHTYTTCGHILAHAMLTFADLNGATARILGTAVELQFLQLSAALALARCICGWSAPAAVLHVHVAKYQN